MRCYALLGAPLLVCLAAAPAAAQTMIGQWTFQGANPLAESTGNWGSLTLVGNATVADGKLDVNASAPNQTRSYLDENRSCAP